MQHGTLALSSRSVVSQVASEVTVHRNDRMKQQMSAEVLWLSGARGEADSSPVSRDWGQWAVASEEGTPSYTTTRSAR